MICPEVMVMFLGSLAGTPKRRPFSADVTKTGLGPDPFWRIDGWPDGVGLKPQDMLRSMTPGI
jgi:hypothetical protein